MEVIIYGIHLSHYFAKQNKNFAWFRFVIASNFLLCFGLMTMQKFRKDNWRWESTVERGE